MSEPAPPQLAVNLERVVQRAAQVAFASAGEIAAQLAMTEEAMHAQAARISELEGEVHDRTTELAEAAAELARVRMSSQQLQVRVHELEAVEQHVDQADAGDESAP